MGDTCQSFTGIFIRTPKIWMFLTFCVKPKKPKNVLKMFFFQRFVDIFAEFPKKLHVLESSKSYNVLTMFLNFSPRSLMFLYTMFL